MNPHYDEIVVGSSLKAILFATKNKCPIFFAKPERPQQFDFFKPDSDLSALLLQNEVTIWKGHGFEEKWGVPKELLWERLLFLHGLCGLSPFSNFCHSLRIQENTLTGHSEYAKLHSVDFDVCYYFDDQKQYNLLPDKREKQEKIYKVYDRIAFRRGGKHEIDIIRTDDKLAGEIWFYPTPRIDGRTPVKDACSISILSQNQIDDFDFSETMVRLKMIEEMRTRGMRGTQNGYQKSGVPRFRSFKTETINRNKQLLSAPLWKETDSIKAPKIKESRLIKDLGKIAENYSSIMRWLCLKGRT